MLRFIRQSVLSKSLKINAYFLPPYSPSLAPVELFFKKIKAKFKAKLSEKNFESKKK